MAGKFKTPPKPNTQALSWFFGEHKKGSLILQPKYQRKAIWSEAQRCFLIDSIVSGCPIPQVYINVKGKGTGSKREDLYEVVDGQQRLRSILDFLADDYKLIHLKKTSYPVSDFYAPLVGKRYSELPVDLQEAIWDYPLAVQELRGLEDEEIRSLFRRLNYVVERLTDQELRHSQYFGDFASTAEQVAEWEEWDAFDLFTRRESQRMRDIEFISELLIVSIAGVQGQEELDTFYAEYDAGFPGKKNAVELVRRTVDSLKSIERTICSTRFRKKADFYALFATVILLPTSAHFAIDLNGIASILEKLNQELERDPKELKGDLLSYYSTVIEGPNKKAKRVERVGLLRAMLEPELTRANKLK